MSAIIIEIAGWIPAIIILGATALQLIHILRRRSAAGVSGTVWLMFGIANLCLYIYTEKYWAYQTIIGLLGTAILDFIIAGLAYGGYDSKKSLKDDAL
jgi:uncharacterized protein with PQ loop repeat